MRRRVDSRFFVSILLLLSVASLPQQATASTENPAVTSIVVAGYPDSATGTDSVSSWALSNFTLASRIDSRFPGPKSPESSSVEPSSPGTVVVLGSYYFCEADAASQPCTTRALWRARMELWDSDPFGLSGPFATTYSTDTGYFEFPPVENKDPICCDGLDAVVIAYLDSSVVQVFQSFESTTPYAWRTDVASNIPDGRFDMGRWTIGGPERGGASIFDTIISGFDYATWVGHVQNKVTAYWPQPATGIVDIAPRTLNFMEGHAWDEDVILHEYAHTIQFQVYGEWIPNSIVPDHDFGECANLRVGFSEGWATFWAVAANHETGYGGVLYPRDRFYTDSLTRPPIAWDLESGQHIPGDCDEGSIANILWDVFDLEDDGGDVLFGGISMNWQVFRYYITGGHHVYDIHEFWNGLFGQNPSLNTRQRLWAIYFDHGINKDNTAPSSTVSALSTVSDCRFTVTWSGSDNLSGIYSFDIQYRDATTGGPWTDQLLNTSSTSAYFVGAGVRTYEFRSRARDQAGNLEPYPSTSDAFTTTSCAIRPNRDGLSEWTPVPCNWNEQFQMCTTPRYSTVDDPVFQPGTPDLTDYIEAVITTTSFQQKAQAFALSNIEDLCQPQGSRCIRRLDLWIHMEVTVSGLLPEGYPLLQTFIQMTVGGVAYCYYELSGPQLRGWYLLSCSTVDGWNATEVNQLGVEVRFQGVSGATQVARIYALYLEYSV